MSHPDPNNPYSKQQPYGSEEPSGGEEHPAYPEYPAYPSYPGGADPSHGYPGGPGGVPTSMPGKVTAARVLMFVAGGLQTLVAAGLVIASTSDEFVDEFSDQAEVEIPGAAFVVLGLIYLIHAIAGIVLGVFFRKGGQGVRISGIVWSSFVIVFGVMAVPVGVLWIALGIVCVVLLSMGDAGAWFRRREQRQEW